MVMLNARLLAIVILTATVAACVFDSYPVRPGQDASANTGGIGETGGSGRDGSRSDGGTAGAGGNTTAGGTGGSGGTTSSTSGPTEGGYFVSGDWHGYVWTRVWPAASTIAPSDFSSDKTGFP